MPDKQQSLTGFSRGQKDVDEVLEEVGSGFTTLSAHNDRSFWFCSLKVLNVVNNEKMSPEQELSSRVQLSD